LKGELLLISAEIEEYFDCDRCDLSLNSGWNCYAASSACVCINCATFFSIDSTIESPTGNPSDGEICHLYQSIPRSQKNRKKHQGRPIEFDTGIQVTAISFDLDKTFQVYKRGVVVDETISISTFTFQLEDITCPACQNLGSLKLYLERGSICPKCRVGNIQEAIESDWMEQVSPKRNKKIRHQ
jgi:hypothetical protein